MAQDFSTEPMSARMRFAFGNTPLSPRHVLFEGDFKSGLSGDLRVHFKTGASSVFS